MFCLDSHRTSGACTLDLYLVPVAGLRPGDLQLSPIMRFIDIRQNSSEIRDRDDENRHLYMSVMLPLMLLALIWLVKLAEVALGINLAFLGVAPRQIGGLSGIITAPLVHGDFDHLMSNSAPLFVTAFLIYNIYRKVAVRVGLFVWIFGGALLWIIGREESYHIGASGLVYGYAFFLFFSGLFRRDMKALAISLLVAFAYGSLIWGVIPSYNIRVSWESHLAGAIVGGILAWLYREVDRPAPRVWEDEWEEEQDDALEAGINWRDHQYRQRAEQLRRIAELRSRLEDTPQQQGNNWRYDFKPNPRQSESGSGQSPE